MDEEKEKRRKRKRGRRQVRGSMRERSKAVDEEGVRGRGEGRMRGKRGGGE